MKSLILKDLIAFKSYMKTLVMFVLFFTIVTYSMDDVGFLSGMVIIWLSMLAITSFSYDNYAKWDVYAQTLPITRKQIVGSKYMLGLLFVGVGVVLAVVLNVAVGFMKSLDMPFKELVGANIAIGLVALLLLALLFPLIFKFGVEKSRMFMLIIIAIPSIAVVALSNAGVDFSSITMQPELVIVIGAVVVAIAMYVSFKTSLRIYLAKDF